MKQEISKRAKSWIYAEDEGSVKIDFPKGTDLEIVTYTRGGDIIGMAFRGNRMKKPFWRYRFPSEARLQQRIDDTIKQRKSYLDDVKKTKEEFVNPYKVGDILVCSWGYDQTNIDFYQVIRTTKASVEIVEIGQYVEKTTGSCDYVMPRALKLVTGNDNVESQLKRVGAFGRVRLNSYSSASKWDGKAKYQTNPNYCR
jgi:hypothetical protein